MRIVGVAGHRARILAIAADTGMTPTRTLNESQMFRIDEGSNSIAPLETRSFAELNFRERAHLQEWIAKQPSCLGGEDLLIIQKEFAGFSETNERLDLLALDKRGSLVLIENKLDDTGRDVVWQALKYASYCSTLSQGDVRNVFQDYLNKTGEGGDAKQKLKDFFGAADYEDISINMGTTQRVILIAANFRREVTSTVLWLLSFGLSIECFRATPYLMGNERLLNLERIIPLPSASQFTVELSKKAMDEAGEIIAEKQRYKTRREFWTQVLSSIKQQTSLFVDTAPATQRWISANSGRRGVTYNFSAGKSHGRAEILIDHGDKTQSDLIFEQLIARKNAIEAAFGGPLVWEKLDDKRANRIKAEIEGNIFEPAQWPVMIDFMVSAMVRLEAATRALLTEREALPTRNA